MQVLKQFNTLPQVFLNQVHLPRRIFQRYYGNDAQGCQINECDRSY